MPSDHIGQRTTIDLRPFSVFSDEKKCRSDGECASDLFCLGGVCFDPCTILDPCNNSLKNGVCRARNHRPVCSCPSGYSFQPETNSCVKGEWTYGS